MSTQSFLCFGGRLRLSGITRVDAGATPETRARLRASLPASNCFFLRFFTTPALQMISLTRRVAWSNSLIRETLKAQRSQNWSARNLKVAYASAEVTV
jgi:hypothetical protein